MFLILAIAGSVGVLIIAHLIFNRQKESIWPITLLSTVFSIFSVVSFLGCLFLAAENLPEEDAVIASYTQSLIWLMSGIVLSVIFCAISAILDYLRKIEFNTRNVSSDRLS